MIDVFDHFQVYASFDNNFWPSFTYPNSRKWSGGTFSPSNAFVWDLIIQSIWPNWRVRDWSWQRSIINETKFIHHQELTIPSHFEKRYTKTTDILHLDSTKSVDDVSLTNHLIEPIFNGSILFPPWFGASMGYWMNSDFVSLIGQLMDHCIIGVLMRYKKGTMYLKDKEIEMMIKLKYDIHPLHIIYIDGN